MYKCPRCGNEKFYVDYTELKTGIYDSEGEYIDDANTSFTLVEESDDWQCTECEYVANRSEFEVEE